MLARQYVLTVVDNSPALAEVNDPIVRVVLCSYFARYRTVINALFLSNPSASSQGVITST